MLSTRAVRYYLFLALLLVFIPSAGYAEDLLAKEQSMLYASNLKKIITPTEFLWLGIWSFVQSFLIALFAGRICFGPTSLLWRTIKLWIYTFFLMIAYGVFVVAVVLAAGDVNSALLAVIVGGILFTIIGLFLLPMRVFEAGFVRALAYLGLTVALGVSASFALDQATPYLLGPARAERFNELTADYKEMKVRPDKDYAASKADTVTEAQEITRQLQAEAAVLKERYAELSKRSSASTTYNVSEKVQYEQDQKKYAQDLAAYNERLKKVQAAVPQPAAPQPSP